MPSRNFLDGGIGHTLVVGAEADTERRREVECGMEMAPSVEERLFEKESNDDVEETE